MLKIHILDVGHGDSIIIESENDGKHYYSVVDCHLVDGKSPTVDFLERHAVRNISTIFITHLDYDHISALPKLLEYIFTVDCKVDLVVCPVLPVMVDDRIRVFEKKFGTTRAGLKSMAEAFKKLECLIRDDGSRTEVTTGCYPGDRYYNKWQNSCHPGYDVAFLSPNNQDIAAYVSGLDKISTLRYSKNNDLSHVMLFQCRSNGDLFLFLGDLDSSRLRNVCNRTLQIYGKQTAMHLKFIKAPHHGAYTKSICSMLKNLLSRDSQGVVAISCKPCDSKHPSTTLLQDFKDNYPGYSICCTGMAPSCAERLELSCNQPESSSPRKLTEFISFMQTQDDSFQILQGQPCHGTILYQADPSGFCVASATSRTCSR